jgi:hypothetical protein
MYIGLHIKYPLFLWACNETWNFWIDFSKNTQVSNFMKIHPVGAKLFHEMMDGRTVGRTDRHDKFCGPFSCMFCPPKKDELTYCKLLKYTKVWSFLHLTNSLSFKISIASILRQENNVVSVHKFTSCFSRIHFNNFLPFTLWSSDWFLPRTVFRIFPNALKKTSKE